jgi:hypothetical protein
MRNIESETALIAGVTRRQAKACRTQACKPLETVGHHNSRRDSLKGLIREEIYETTE